MGQTHPSTPAERAQWAVHMLAHQGTYGMVTHLSRTHRVSRPTLYAWRDRAAGALARAFSPQPTTLHALVTPTARQILTLWIAHASTRGIQAATRELLQRGRSLATITTVLHDAQQRALTWMHTHVPATSRALALDEIYANRRTGAYLNVVDVHSGAVWASEGPLAVDCESWTLVLWSMQDRGLHWERVVMDESAPMHTACQQVTPAVRIHLDQWHLWHVCAQVQARLTRRLAELVRQTPVVARQAARLAAGRPLQGRWPKTDRTAHAADVAAAERVAGDVAYLTQELRRLLAVVVIERQTLLTPEQRQVELDALLRLLDAVAADAPGDLQGEVQALARRVRRQLPKLLAFVDGVARVAQDLAGVLAPEHQALVAWAWQRRDTLEWANDDLLAALPEAWRTAARVLLATWDDAVCVSSAVERWHSILRPHLAVRRTLTTGMLALLAVWHNHRVFTRGIHTGQSPLHMSGMTDAPTDWLVALGYPPDMGETTQAVSLAQAA
jgi:Transposase